MRYFYSHLHVLLRLPFFVNACSFTLHPTPISMNRMFHPSAEVLLFRLSNGAEHHKGGKGKFIVTYQKNRKKAFSTLLEAFLFYITLDEAAFLWDITKEKTLIERKVTLCLN